MPSATNSHSGSLGASISDLSSEAASEISDNSHLNLKTTKAIKSSLNEQSLNNGANNNTLSRSSRLPVPKK
jgi:hypothetical protein